MSAEKNKGLNDIVTNLVNKITLTTFLMKIEEHNIVVYVNATPYCTTIELEHHRGPCR